MMGYVGQREIRTQKSVLAFLQNALGYRYLGNWKDRSGNSNIEQGMLTEWLERQGHDKKTISRTIDLLEKANTVIGERNAYYANKDVYAFLRYGIKVKPDIREQYKTVWLIDWDKIENNDFAVAEEVTIIEEHTKRPDIVLYVNGIAFAVLELKRSTVSVTEGIRQNLDNQKKQFIRRFFSTIQLVMAGNDTEGLRYAVIGTPEKYYMRWKETEAHPLAGDNPLLRELGQLCRKDRLLEIVHDFISFDAGIKKTCRHSQYFGVKAAQESIRHREGGIIWHTQGSGKSLIMVWLSRWIRENVTGSRVLIVTDRIELDEQIERVFNDVKEDILRTKSGADLIQELNTNERWLICSLVHKFGAGEGASENDVREYLDEINRNLPVDFKAKGEIFVFVDECHRTQSGVLHDSMKELLPEAMFIGFTGTPLLKKDKQKSIEVFGPYIHTYKYDEAVRDGVVLDLRYEARDIDQNLTSPKKVDEWFEIKTRGLSDVAKAQLKKRWGRMQEILSSEDRLQKIVNDILMDMERKDRLQSGNGNAMLIAESIYSACKLYEMFSKAGFGDKCAIVTSYRPTIASIRGEETGEGFTQRLLEYKIYRKMLADFFDEPEDRAINRVEKFEKEVKRRFIEEPGQMKLLIVVDKLLTGFDAPPATYLYIDKQMRDHGLFQAICRVNRLHTEDKEYGYIIDYKDLFKSLESSIKDYTGGALDGYDREDVEGLLKDRLEKARERLEELLESIKALCEPVEPPKGTASYIKYFCAKESGNVEQLKENEPKRVALYNTVSALVRAYANLANEMEEAGYSSDEISTIKHEVSHYENVRQEIKLASGDYVDMKAYEPAMRHLLDTYIRAEESEVLSNFDDMTLVEMIVDRGESAIDNLPVSIRKNKEAVSETIENNVRKLIIDESPVNPRYYEKMSLLLDELIQERRRQTIDYKTYLEQIVKLAKQVARPETEAKYPGMIDTPAKRAFYDNLDQLEDSMVKDSQGQYKYHNDSDSRAKMAIALDKAIRDVKKADWRGNQQKEREVEIAIKKVLGHSDQLIKEIFEIAKNQRDY